jgi:hypothetical protein
VSSKLAIVSGSGAGVNKDYEVLLNWFESVQRSHSNFKHSVLRDRSLLGSEQAVVSSGGAVVVVGDKAEKPSI